MEFKDGDMIQVNGKLCRIEGGALVPVVERGPLGGELKRICDLYDNQKAYIPIVLKNGTIIFTDPDVDENCVLSVRALCETNVPPRPQFIPTTAGEAAKLHDIVGRWVAVKVDDCGMNYICSQKCDFMTTDQILLIEGVDLP